MEDRDFEQMLEKLMGQGLPVGSETFRDALLERCLAELDADDEGLVLDDAELDLLSAAGDPSVWFGPERRERDGR